MKTRLPTLVLVCVLLCSATGVAIAQPEGTGTFETLANPGDIISNGPYGGSVLQLMNDPSSNAGIYAAVKQVGLFHSPDYGNTWTFLFSGIGAQGNFAIDAVDPDLIYATREGEGLYRSQDAGSTWSFIPLAEDVTQVYSVRAFTHPTVEKTVYAALSYGNRDFECVDECGLYRSTDAGDTWEWVGASFPADAKINALTFLPSNADVMYAGAQDGSLYRSEDGGETWTSQDNPESHVHDLVFTPGGTLYVVGSGEGVSLPMLACVEETVGSDVQLDCRDGDSNPNYVIITSSGPPSDAGNTVTDIKVNPNDPSDLLVSTGYYAARSTNGGTDWQFYEHTTGAAQPSAVLYDPAPGSTTIYVGNSQGVRKTTQAGNPTAVWTEINDELAGVVPTRIASAPSDPQVVYVNSQAGMYRTLDGADTWERLPTYCDGGFCFSLDTPFAIDPQDSQKLVLAAWNYTVHLSDNGGETWSVHDILEKPADLPGPVEPLISFHALIALPGEAGTYLGGVAFHDPDNPDFNNFAGGGIYKSADGGLTWDLVMETTAQSINSLAYDPTTPGRVYAGGCVLASEGPCDYAAILVSDDLGDTWAPFTAGDPVLENTPDAGLIAVNPANGRLYVQTGSALIMLNKGENDWNEWGGVPGGSPINQILFDPAPLKTASVVYAATPDGLFVSETAGQGFEPFDGDLGQADVTALAAAHKSSGENFIFIGTAGGQFSETGITGLSTAAGVDDTLIPAGVFRMDREEHYIFLPAAIHD